MGKIHVQDVKDACKARSQFRPIARVCCGNFCFGITEIFIESSRDKDCDKILSIKIQSSQNAIPVTMNSANTIDAGIVVPNEDTPLAPLQQRPPAGSNLACDSDSDAGTTTRIRREWNHLDSYDRALYLDAVETAIERGLHQRFTIFHYDEVSEIQAHDTCGFYMWHRVFVLAYENMLRSLEPRFACLALPFWDIYRDYQKQESSTNSCESYATCAGMINDLGGIVENDDSQERTFFGRKANGLWHFQPPVQNLRDDNNRVGVVRYDLWFDPIPEDASILSPENIAELFGTENRVDFWEVLHHGIHDSVHDTIGGFMRTPVSSIDPLFMPLHSTMEFFDYVWEACHYSAANETNSNSNNVGTNQCVYTRHAKQHFPNISLSTDEVFMKLDNATDIRDDPEIGTYFSHAMRFADLEMIQDLDKHHRFRYAGIPQNFVSALENNTQACPNGLASILSFKDEKVIGTEVVRREPPTFSYKQLETFKQDWIQEAEAYYNGETSITAANDDSPANLLQEGRQQFSENNNNALIRMEFVKCILFEAMDRDTIERWAIDRDAFLKQVVVNERYNTHPDCRDFLSSAPAVSGMDNGDSSSGSTTTPLETNESVGSGGMAYRGASNQSCWLLTVLLICFVSKFSR
jgi:hypothetical protein